MRPVARRDSFGAMRSARNTFLLSLVVAVASVGGVGSAFCGGAVEDASTRIILAVPQRVFVSPQESEGDQDTLVVPFSLVPDQPDAVRGYRFSVSDASGQTVWSTHEEVEQPGFLTEVLETVGLVERRAVVVPEYLSWDGSTAQGVPVSDGVYTCQVEVLDALSRRHASSTLEVVVDNRAPLLSVSVGDIHFSPNGDGNEDEILIEQTGSSENLWSAAITNTHGRMVRQYTWENGAPAPVLWDGLSDDGSPVPDGVYAYEISCRDPAGNTTAFRVPNIIVDTTLRRIALETDLSSFSPNGDERSDILTFALIVPDRNHVSGWRLAVSDAAGSTRWTVHGGDEIPLRLRFEGADASGNVLPGGAYRGELSVTYENGSNPKASCPVFTIDLTAPSAIVDIYPAVFSPNGDGYGEELVILQETSEEDYWSGAIWDSKGRVVRHFLWEGRAVSELRWDGRADDSAIVPDGTYTYTATATDAAGNVGESIAVEFEKNCRTAIASVHVKDAWFSPNWDGFKDTVRIDLGNESADGVEGSVLTILDREGNPLRIVEKRAPFDKYEWDGLSAEGRVVPDGEYSVRFEVLYSNGYRSFQEAGPIIVDTQAPRVSLHADGHLISPDGDGAFDTLTIIYEVRGERGCWQAEIRDELGSVVRSWTWEQIPGRHIWDGTDADGLLVPDGEFSYVFSGADRAGNHLPEALVKLVVDTRRYSAALHASGTHLSPNGDGAMESLILEPRIEGADHLMEWELSVVDRDGTVGRTYQGGSKAMGGIEFDGRGTEGVLHDGAYRGVLTVSYGNGAAIRTESPTFSIDTLPPRAAAAISGRTVFSPDGDGLFDQVTIVHDVSEEELWIGTISDRAGSLVASYSWRGAAPRQFYWDGRAADGQTVPDGPYTYQLASTDRAGNYGESETVVFTVDTRPTAVELTVGQEYFSPNGDGVKDFLLVDSVAGVADGVRAYAFAIRDEAGAVVERREGEGILPERFIWEGTDGIEDGRYVAELDVEYEKGNRPKATSETFFVDTEYPWVRVQVIRPDGEREGNIVRIVHETSEEDVWVGEMLDGWSMVLIEQRWIGRAGTYEWDGKDGNGQEVGDGEYLWRISSEDRAGNKTVKTVSGIWVGRHQTSDPPAQAAQLF